MHPIEAYLEQDHRRLEDILDRAVADIDHVDKALYTTFREGLLRHISMEERVLIPAIRRMREAEGRDMRFEEEAQIRLDHGAIGTLLVLPPDAWSVAALRGVLAAHNPLEEGDHGLYAEIRRLDEAASADVRASLDAIPTPPLSPYMDSTAAYGPARRAMERAGHDPDRFPGAPAV